LRPTKSSLKNRMEGKWSLGISETKAKGTG